MINSSPLSRRGLQGIARLAAVCWRQQAHGLRVVASSGLLSMKGGPVTTANADPQSWPWPDSLDALAAAPDHHRLLLENDRVRVLEVRIAPGELVPVHTHRWPSVVFTVSAADFIRRDGQGEFLL